MKEMTDKYYESFSLCQSEHCGAKTRVIRLKEEKCPLFDCKSKSIQILQEKRIYQNFRHLKNLFDYQLIFSLFINFILKKEFLGKHKNTRTFSY